MDNSQDYNYPSWKGRFEQVWFQLKRGVTNCSSGGQKKPSVAHGKRFLSAVSWLQFILGFLCICVALLGIAAAYNARENATRRVAEDLQWKIGKFYQETIMNIAQKAGLMEMQLKQSHEEEIRLMQKNNCTKPVSNRPDILNEKYNEYFSHDHTWHSNVGVSANITARLKDQHLIIDFLAIPSWIGIMMIITSLVGFRRAQVWDNGQNTYLQVSFSHSILNMLLALLFVPGMLGVGITQIVLGGKWENYNDFRKKVGIATTAIAGIALVLSMIIATVNCCFPVGPQEKGYTKQQSETEEKEILKKAPTAIVA